MREAQLALFAFSPTGKQIATTNDAGRVTLRAPESGWQIARLLDFPGYARDVAFSPDGRTLVVATGDDDDIRFWVLAELLGASGPERPDVPVLGDNSNR
jgi:WD40 repeat protein